MTYDELAGSVKLSEGFRDHVYMDTEGFATIGWGHKVTPDDNFEEGKTYTKEELQEVFDKDLNNAIGKARALMEQNGVTDLPTTAQHTL
jgi:GH24 family phage-related lysozyme (muramidase)